MSKIQDYKSTESKVQITLKHKDGGQSVGKMEYKKNIQDTELQHIIYSFCDSVGIPPNGDIPDLRGPSNNLQKTFLPTS